MRCARTCVLGALVSVLSLTPACVQVANLGKPCAPACVDGSTRLVCDDETSAHAEPCPQPAEPCLHAVCSTGACVTEPNDGITCGVDDKGVCDGGSCLGPDMKISGIR